METAATVVQKFLRSELSFYATIITAVLTIAGFYFGLTNQMNLMAQKIETHIESTEYMPLAVATIKEQIAVLVSQHKGS
jgi:cell division protein FtsL